MESRPGEVPPVAEQEPNAAVTAVLGDVHQLVGDERQPLPALLVAKPDVVADGDRAAPRASEVPAYRPAGVETHAGQPATGIDAGLFR